MRIAISGTASQGKSTLISDFLKRWPMYKTPERSYRDIIEEKGLQHSSKTTKETQDAILDHMIDELQKYDKDDHVIFDRCPLDNIIYSMWAADKGVSDIDDAYIREKLVLVRESLRLLDIIFFIPITNVAPVKIEEDGTRETNSEYIQEIDNLFKAVEQDHRENPNTVFFVPDDKPPMIEIFGGPRERIEMIKLYLDDEGDAMEVGNIISAEELEEAEKLKKIWEQQG